MTGILSVSLKFILQSWWADPVSEELRKLNTEIKIQLTDDMKKYVNESHIPSSTNDI